jgi:thiamine biosynthesis lipoprotein
VQHQLVLVSVINTRAGLADALATGLLVLGPQAGYRVAESEGLAVLFIERNGDTPTPRWTPAFIYAVQSAEGL